MRKKIRTMSTRFGWCITSQHESCIRKIQWNGDLLCDCDCHASDAVEYLPEPELTSQGETNEEHDEG